MEVRINEMEPRTVLLWFGKKGYAKKRIVDE